MRFIAARCRAGADAVRSARCRNVVAKRGGTISEDFQRVGESRRRFEGMGANATTQLRRAFDELEFPRTLAEGSKISRPDCATSCGYSLRKSPFRPARRPVPGAFRSFEEASKRARERVRILKLCQLLRRTGGNGFQLSSSTRRATCSPSASTSPNAGATPSFYDLLASEARLCSYVAIAQGQVPQDHWFSMGRLLVASRRRTDPGFVERIDVRIFDAAAGHAQLREHLARSHLQGGGANSKSNTGNSRGVPWGISESGYNRTDVQLNYQYRAFGVPGLGLKRGLAEDLVDRALCHARWR